MNANYRAALEELNRFVNYERSGEYPAGAGGLGTARMEKLLAALGSPETRCPASRSGSTGQTLTAAAIPARERPLRTEK